MAAIRLAIKTDRARSAAAALLLLFASLALTFTSGAHESGFGGFDDESAHLMSSLMVRDYVLTGFPASPLEFAKDYYTHYPRVALGKWPPMLAALLGSWTIAFGATKTSVLVFTSVLSAAAAWVLYRAARGISGGVTALLAGLLFLLVPVVQEFGQMVLTEVPQALFCTLAVLEIGRFVDSGRARHSLLFALWAVLAILTKGNGLFLALVPPLAVVATGRWSLLRSPALWGSAVIVTVCCAPWYLFTRELAAKGFGGGPERDAAGVLQAAGFYSGTLLGLAGWGVGLAALLGFAVKWRAEKQRGLWAAVAAWVLIVVSCQAFVPTSFQPRYLVPVVPAWILGAVAGTSWLSQRLVWLRPRGISLPALLAGLAFLPVFEWVPKEDRGFEAAARSLLADESLAESLFLIESDPRGQGLFITGVALNESRPGHVILRADKMLARTNFLGTSYEASFETAAQVRDLLAKVPVAIVLIDDSMADHQVFPHHDLLRRAVEQDPATWTLLGDFDVVRSGVSHAGALHAWRQKIPADHPREPVDLRQLQGLDLSAP